MRAHAFLLSLVVGATHARAGLQGLTFIPANSALVRWVGRVALTGAGTNGSVYFDWEGVQAYVAVQQFTTVIAEIADNCPGTPVGGGSRWAVYYTPGNPNTAAPNHRIQTFYSGPASSLYYMFIDPSGKCDPGCDLNGTSVFRLVRLTESRLTGCNQTANMSVTGFWTDGLFVAPPASSGRRLEAIGDSISAGDLNSGDGQHVCGNAAFNNDITQSSAGILCDAFGADCMYTAWGGIRLGMEAWGMKDLYPFTFSASGQNAYTAWDFTSWVPDGVIVNLGTNDRPPPPATNWINAYVAFASKIVNTYYASPNVTLFLAYGPMTTEYEPFVLNITSQLQAAGVRAYSLNLTLPTPMTGCYGHPSAADNMQIAANVKSYIGNILGWS